MNCHFSAVQADFLLEGMRFLCAECPVSCWNRWCERAPHSRFLEMQERNPKSKQKLAQPVISGLKGRSSNIGVWCGPTCSWRGLIFFLTVELKMQLAAFTLSEKSWRSWVPSTATLNSFPPRTLNSVGVFLFFFLFLKWAAMYSPLKELSALH